MKRLVITYWDETRGCKSQYQTYTNKVTTAILRFESVFENEILDFSVFEN